MSERKIHVLEDGELGGVLREYVEVDRRLEPTDIIHIDDQRYRMVERRAEIGETIISLDEDPTEKHEYSVGDILTVEDAYKSGRNYCVSFLNGRAFWSTDQYRVLEPTDIVHIDGQRYRMVDREAKVGERIIIVNGYGWYRDKVGYIYDVIHPSKYDFEGNDNSRAYVEYEKNAYNDVIHFVRRGNYRVLEPIEPTEIVTPEEGDDKSVLDLLANLSRRVAELERKLTETNKPQAHPQVVDMLANLSRRIVALEKKINRLEQTDISLHRDIETWAQEVERLKSRVKTESVANGAPTKESVEKSLKEVLDLIYGSAEEE